MGTAASQGGTKRGKEADTAVSHGTSWIDAAWLMLSDVVGTSVLTFGGVAAQLGSVLSCIFIVGLFPVSLYVSVLMSRTRALVVKTADLQRREPPHVETMGEVAAQIFRAPGAGNSVCLMVYGYTLLGNASYLLVMGSALQMIFFRGGMCIYEGVALSCAIALLPVVFTRKLGDSVLLCFANLFLIVGVIVLALGAIAVEGRPPCTESPAFAPGLSLLTALGAATNVIYSYSGQWMYFEIMDTMERPSEFPRAFAVTGPVMVSIYLAVALVAHYLGVDKGDIVEAMPRGPALQAAAVLLFVHVLIVYLIKSVVLQRFCHFALSPADADKRSAVAYAKHGSYGLVMLIFGYLVANAVPFFYQMLGLIGGLLGGPINFLFPIYMYLAAVGRHEQAAQAQRAERGGGDAEGQSAAAPGSGGSWGQEAAAAKTEAAGRWRWEVSSTRAAAQGFRSLSMPEKVAVCLIFVAIGMTMVLGVTEEVKQIVALSGQFGEPFACHALAPRFAASADVLDPASCT
mmetsp:Transcript_13793/g.35022  ORF Transcript_13793/g.35022 Transcript_13793/m.35022 type:complete len:515 (+) Transcript_13793:63-1607(+)